MTPHCPSELTTPELKFTDDQLTQITRIANNICAKCNFIAGCNIYNQRYNPKYRIPLNRCTTVEKNLKRYGALVGDEFILEDD